jgi:hypothetical protein
MQIHYFNWIFSVDLILHLTGLLYCNTGRKDIILSALNVTVKPEHGFDFTIRLPLFFAVSAGLY